MVRSPSGQWGKFETGEGAGVSEFLVMSVHLLGLELWSAVASAHSTSVRVPPATELTTFEACDWRAGVTCEWPTTMSWFKPLSGRDAREQGRLFVLL